MNEIDEKLLEIYVLGFQSELSLESEKYHKLHEAAYRLGVADAKVCDDIKSVVGQSDLQILARIKESK